MGIYATWLSITDDEHELTCATWRKATKAEARESRTSAQDGSGRYWVPSGLPCDCPDKAPIIYRGSHVNPAYDDPRGGYVFACAIPDHCHPDARFGEGEPAPVDFLRLSVGEHHATYHGGEAGTATVVLDKRQVKQLRRTLGQWLRSKERA